MPSAVTPSGSGCRCESLSTMAVGEILSVFSFYLLFISWAIRAKIQSESVSTSKNAFNGRRQEQSLDGNVGGLMFSRIF